MSFNFFLRQFTVHHINIQFSVQVIQLMADCPRFKSLGFIFVPLPFPVLETDLDPHRPGDHPLPSRYAQASLTAGLASVCLNDFRIHKFKQPAVILGDIHHGNPPQNADLNQGLWERLEVQVRGQINSCDTLYVVTGCVLTTAADPSRKTVNDADGNPVAVPKAYYKVLLKYTSGTANGGYSADCKSCLDLLTLMAPQGTVLTITADGEDSKAAVDAIETLFNHKFYEDEFAAMEPADL